MKPLYCTTAICTVLVLLFASGCGRRENVADLRETILTSRDPKEVDEAAQKLVEIYKGAMDDTRSVILTDIVMVSSHPKLGDIIEDALNGRVARFRRRAISALKVTKDKARFRPYLDRLLEDPNTRQDALLAASNLLEPSEASKLAAYPGRNQVWAIARLTGKFYPTDLSGFEPSLGNLMVPAAAGWVNDPQSKSILDPHYVKARRYVEDFLISSYPSRAAVCYELAHFNDPWANSLLDRLSNDEHELVRMEARTMRALSRALSGS